MAVAVLGDREPFTVVLLAVVLHQTDQTVASIGAQSSEHAADVDGTVLVRVADQADRASGALHVCGEAREVAGPEHGGLVDDNDGPGREAVSVVEGQVRQEPGDGGRFGPGRAREPGGAFEFRGGGCRHCATEDRYTGVDVGGDDCFERVRLAGAGSP